MGWLGSTASARLRKLEEVLSMAAVARELRTAEGVESQQVWRPFIIASVWEAGALPYAWASRISPGRRCCCGSLCGRMRSLQPCANWSFKLWAAHLLTEASAAAVAAVAAR